MYVSKVSSLSIILAVLISGCGDQQLVLRPGSSDSQENGARTPSTSLSGDLSPKIDSLSARMPDSGTTQFYVDIKGKNLDQPDIKVELEKDGNLIELVLGTFESGSIRAFIPVATQLVEGAYNLVVSSAHGSSSGVITTLKGDTGLQGPIGLPGPAGIAGPVGATGLQGVQGPIGLTGPAGSQGAKGDKGLKGDTGLQGAVGPQGPTGLPGPAGAVGPQGIQGPIGLTGPKGDKGDEGLKGPIGEKGLKGDTGLQGAVGAQGPTGLPGPAGKIGPQGIQGPIGLTGPKGDTGPQGIQGPVGLTGPKGDTGPQGIQGLVGLTGPAGPKGDTGFTPWVQIAQVEDVAACDGSENGEAYCQGTKLLRYPQNHPTGFNVFSCEFKVTGGRYLFNNPGLYTQKVDYITTNRGLRAPLLLLPSINGNLVALHSVDLMNMRSDWNAAENPRNSFIRLELSAFYPTGNIASEVTLVRYRERNTNNEVEQAQLRGKISVETRCPQ